MVVLVVLIGVGAFLAYQNTLPTTVATNFKNAQKDVPTDGSFVLTFSRSVSLDLVQAALSITPATDGTITPGSGQTQYAWTPSKPLPELATYTITLKPILDLSGHHVNGGQWSFTTIIIPRVVAITAADGTALKDGTEIDPSSTLKLTFNDQMEPVTIKATIGGKIVARRSRRPVLRQGL